MSVYKRDYRAYSGRVTTPWTRILVLLRYGLAEIWASKITLGLVTLSLLPVIVFLVQIFLANNPAARLLVFKGNTRLLDIDASFFLNVLETQCWLALVVTSWIAPRLITFDLADNALPLLLSRPISRFGYLFGKFMALMTSLSLSTWIPCLVLFAYQSYSSSQPWGMQNLRILAALLAGTLIWIAFLSLLGLALSAWVKWRGVATGIIFAAVLVPAGVGGIISAVLRTRWGFVLNLPIIMTQLWQRLLGAPEVIRPRQSLPDSAIASALIVASLICFAMLHVRIRAREVVRG
jgi:ABC-type transport system involved in multi-copper enzyme maturation permease subunit